MSIQKQWPQNVRRETSVLHEEWLIKRTYNVHSGTMHSTVTPKMLNTQHTKRVNHQRQITKQKRKTSQSMPGFTHTAQQWKVIQLASANEEAGGTKISQSGELTHPPRLFFMPTEFLLWLLDLPLNSELFWDSKQERPMVSKCAHSQPDETHWHKFDLDTVNVSAHSWETEHQWDQASHSRQNLKKKATKQS